MGRVQGQASQARISGSLGLELCVRSLFGNKGLRLKVGSGLGFRV